MVTLLAIGLAACQGGTHDGGGTSAGTTTPPQTKPPPSGSAAGTPTPTPDPPSCSGSGLVEVSDAGGLSKALSDARPGQVIHLADGTYNGQFTASARAASNQPIVLCGGRGAVLDGGSTDSGYTLHLSGAVHWRLSGFSVTGGQKGVVVDGGVGDIIQGLSVTGVGDEAIHLRAGSTDNQVLGNVVRDTGKLKREFGEGVYIGTAKSNWCQISHCGPDRSDRNLIAGNDIAGTTAEAVDIKEGTSDGVLQDNLFDGSSITAADSWVDVKGNDWTIRGNRGSTSRGDGFQVHEVVDGWGVGNRFLSNTATGVAGYAINLAGPSSMRDSTLLTCDNHATGNGRGLSNTPCQKR